MAIVNGTITALALLTFIGIVCWAFAKFRVAANEQAAMLPFALPEEGWESGQENGQEAAAAASVNRNESINNRQVNHG